MVKVDLFGTHIDIETDKDGKYISVDGMDKIYVEKDDGGEYVMYGINKYYLKQVGGRTRNRRKRRSRKYKK